MNLSNAILSIALTTAVLSSTAHALTIKNTSKTKGFWITVYNTPIRAIADSGCVEPGKLRYFPEGNGYIVRVQVTADSRCQQGPVICDTDMGINTDAPLSAFPDDHGGCFIDRVSNRPNDPTYNSQQMNELP